MAGDSFVSNKLNNRTMTNLQTLAVAALLSAGTMASAQTSISNEEGISSEMSSYLTVEEKMDATEENIKILTDDLLSEENSEEKDAIRKKIQAEQKTLIELKREHEERKAIKPGNRTVRIFEGDLIRNDLELKSFRTHFNSETNELKISFRTSGDDDTKITLLTPGKEVIHETESSAMNKRHHVELTLETKGFHTYCVNIESNGKSLTKMIAL